jgi:hypothetical protein
MSVAAEEVGDRQNLGVSVLVSPACRSVGMGKIGADAIGKLA